MTGRECIVCCGQLGPHDRLRGLLRCSNCSFVTADLSVSAEDLRKLYSGQYFHGGEYKDYVAERATHEKHFRHRIRRLRQYVDRPGEKFLFEVGCAYGFFLSLAKNEFGRVAGIDLSEEAACYAARTLGLDASAGDFLDYEFSGKPDVVCLWDTIEHLARPDLYVEKLAANMDKGAVLAITTGDIGSLIARARGARWRLIHPPTHLHYFSEGTLSRLLQNYGFRVRHSSHEGTYRTLDTAAYIILATKHGRPGIYNVLKRTGLLGISFYLNLYDILFVVARKEE